MRITSAPRNIYLRMRSPFPFHGIFSSLGTQEDGDDGGIGQPLPDDKPSGRSQRGTGGQVAVDIFEVDGYYVIRALIAGVSMNDLDVEVSDNTVTIRGSRRKPDTVEDSQYYLQECFFGPFSRTVTLPCQIDPKKVKATFNKECVLKVIVPKEEKVKIVRISEA